MMRRKQDEGQTTVMIVAFAAVLMMLIAVVIDVSAAYLQRQGLDNLADGAALSAADAAADGSDVYADGLGEDLALDEAAARTAAGEYLRDVGARQRYPGLRVQVRVDHENQRVVVEVEAPLDLPLSVPGGPETTTIGSTGNASVDVSR